MTELNATNLIIGLNLDLIKGLCSILKPLELTVLALSRKDANLITAKGAINFLLKKLDRIVTQENTLVEAIPEINKLKENIKTRLCSRENSDLNSFLSCLLQQKIPTKENLNFGTRLLNRLYPYLSTSAVSDDIDS